MDVTFISWLLSTIYWYRIYDTDKRYMQLFYNNVAVEFVQKEYDLQQQPDQFSSRTSGV